MGGLLIKLVNLILSEKNDENMFLMKKTTFVHIHFHGEKNGKQVLTSIQQCNGDKLGKSKINGDEFQGSFFNASVVNYRGF